MICPLCRRLSLEMFEGMAGRDEGEILAAKFRVGFHARADQCPLSPLHWWSNTEALMADWVKPPPQQIFPAIRPSTSLPVPPYIPLPLQLPWVVTLRPETSARLRKPEYLLSDRGGGLLHHCAPDFESRSVSIFFIVPWRDVF